LASFFLWRIIDRLDPLAAAVMVRPVKELVPVRLMIKMVEWKTRVSGWVGDDVYYELLEQLYW
jgi:hypothetical protein